MRFSLSTSRKIRRRRVRRFVRYAGRPPLMGKLRARCEYRPVRVCDVESLFSLCTMCTGVYGGLIRGCNEDVYAAALLSF